jgi:hypothetical protein
MNQKSPLESFKSTPITVCFALQDLELPAPLTLEILDALFPPNNIRMWAKWELITMVKHFHQRHERAGRPTDD